MINQHFEGFLHDKCIYTGNCETDEFAHRSYDQKDEEIRYDDLVMVFTGNWIWIRFNPDSNRDKTPFKEKLECLRKEIEKHIKRIKEGKNTYGKDTYQFEIHKLFY